MRCSAVQYPTLVPCATSWPSTASRRRSPESRHAELPLPLRQGPRHSGPRGAAERCCLFLDCGAVGRQATGRFLHVPTRARRDVGVDRPSITPGNIRRIGGRHSRVWWTHSRAQIQPPSNRDAGSRFHSVLPCALATASQKRAEARITRPASRARSLSLQGAPEVPANDR